MLQLMFIGIALFALYLFFVGTGRKLQVLVLGLGIMIVLSILSYVGFFRDSSAVPPRMLWVLLSAGLFVSYSLWRTAGLAIKPAYLLSIHILRVPVEIGLYALYLNGEIPVIMTFSGLNFDILFGISAAVLWGYGFIFQREIPSTLFRAWNSLGIVLLLFIVGLAILSAESPIQLLAFDQPNKALLTFPYILLPGIIVPLVLLAHLCCLKVKKPFQVLD